MKLIKMTATAALLYAGSAFATGSVDCEGKAAGVVANVTWSTSHTEGAQMISPITVKLSKGKDKEKDIVLCETKSTLQGCEKATAKGTVVGYWVSSERILVNVIDDNLVSSMFKVETWWNKKKKQYTGAVTLKSPLVEKETKIPVKCDQA